MNRKFEACPAINQINSKIFLGMMTLAIEGAPLLKVLFMRGWFKVFFVYKYIKIKIFIII